MCPKCRDHGCYKVAKIQDPPIAFYNPQITNSSFEAVRVYCNCEIGQRLRVQDRYLRLDFDS